MAARIALVLMALASAALCAADPVELPAFMEIPRPEPTLQLRYGSAPDAAIDVFLPQAPGPYPVAILIHGGCWSAHTAGREQLRHIGAELARQGIAAWSIGYRRADEEGAAIPGPSKMWRRPSTSCAPRRLIISLTRHALSWSVTRRAVISLFGRRRARSCQRAARFTGVKRLCLAPSSALRESVTSSGSQSRFR
jgi:hypothetical protein